MVFNATFNNISAISWRSVVLVEETGVSGENHRAAANYWSTLSHNVLSTSRHERDSNWQLLLWYALIAYVVVNPTIILSWPRWSPLSVSKPTCKPSAIAIAPRVLIWFQLRSIVSKLSLCSKTSLKLIAARSSKPLFRKKICFIVVFFCKKKSKTFLRWKNQFMQCNW